MLWELLTGTRPQPALDQFPALPASCSRSLRQLLWQMVQPQVEQRPPAREVALLLGQWAAPRQGGTPRCA
jgi:hypothetical protein